MRVWVAGIGIQIMQIGLIMFGAFAEAGSQVGSVSVAASKRLSEGLSATMSGIGATLQTLQALLDFMSNTYNAWLMAYANMRVWLAGIGVQIMQIGVAMLLAFMEAGQYLGSVQVTAVKLLSDGLNAVMSAVGAGVDGVQKLISFLSDASNRAVMESESGRAALVWFGTALVLLGGSILGALAPATLYLSQQTVNATKLLTEGVGAVFGALGSALDNVGKLLDFTARETYRTAVATETGRAGLVALGTNLILMGGAIMGALAPATLYLSKQTVDGVKLLQEGAGAALALLGNATDAFVKLIDFASNSTYRAAASSEQGRAGLVQLANGLIAFGQALLKTFTDANITIGQPTVDAAQRFADAVGSVAQVVSDALDIVVKFQETLSSHFHINQAEILRIAWDLFNLGKELSQTLLAVANTYGSEVKPNAEHFKDALALTSGVLKDAWDVAGLLTTVLDAGGVKISQGAASQALATLYAYADRLSRDLLALANQYSGEVAPNATEFGKALAFTSQVVSDSWDVLSLFMEIISGGGVNLTFADATRLLDDLYIFGEILANQLLNLANRYDGQVKPAATNFGQALSLTSSVASDAWDLVSLLIEALAAGGVNLTFADATRLFDDLYIFGEILANQFLNLANRYDGEVKPNATNFGQALSLTSSVAGDAWDLISGLMEAFKAGGVTISDADAQTLFARLLSLGKLLADQYLAAGNVYQGEVKDNAKTFADALSVTNSVAGDAWSLISGLMDALKAGGVTITDADAKTLFARLLSLGQLLADQYLAVGNVYGGSVKDNARTFADALSVSNSASGDAIGLISDLQKFLKDGGVTISEADAKKLLNSVLTLGRTLANDFLAIANVYGGSVKDAANTFADALSVSNSAIGDGIGLISELQDFVKAKGITVSVDQLVALVTDVARAGVRLANAFLAVGNVYRGTVTDNAKNFAEALSVSNSAIGDGIGLISELADYKVPDYSIANLVVLAQRIADDGRRLAEAFIVAARNFDATGNVAASDLADAISSMSSGISDALDALPGLIKTLPNYRSLSSSMMTQLGFLLDDIVAVVKAFGQRAKSIDWRQISTEAMSNLAGGASDAWSAISDTLGGIEKLMDPERVRMPSAAQLGSMIDQLLPLIQSAVLKVASLSTVIPKDDLKAAQDNAAAVGAVFDALSTAIQAIQDAVGLNVGSSGMNNLSEILRWVKDLFKQIVDAFNEGSDAAAAMTSMVNTLENIGGFAGTTIGTKLIDSLVAAIEAGSGRVASALAGILAPVDTGADTPTQGGGGRRLLPPPTAPGAGEHGSGPTYNITLIQYVTQQIAADPTGTILQIRDAVT